MALARLGLLAWLAWLGAGCAERGDRFCQLGAERTVARSVALEFDGIELLPWGDGALALWSDSGGLFARALDRHAQPTGEARRVGARCAGGLAVLARDDGLELACSSPAADGKHADGGGLAVYQLDRELKAQRRRRVGAAGPLSAGVALGRDGRELAVAWHDGAPDAHRVWWASLAAGAEPPRVLSTTGRMAAAPSLAVRDGQARVAWAERWLHQGELRSRVAYWDGSGTGRNMLPVAHLQAMPQLIELGGQPLLAYRDRRGKGDRTGLYLTRVAGRGELVGETARVGRADGVGRPALAPCMGGLVTATPRTYGADYFVGINWLDRGLTRVRGEQQFYEDTHAFSRAAVACVGDQALILIAEYAELHDADGAALRAVPYRCR